MKLKKFVKTLIVMMTLVLFSSNIVVYADREEVDSVTYIVENSAEILSICNQANTEVGVKILVYTGKDGLLSFSNEKYLNLTINERKEFMEVALLSTKESGLGSKVKNKVYNFIAEQDSTTSAAVKYLKSDASADFVKASTWFKPFSSGIGVVLGLLSLFIFGFIALSIVFDIAYMFLPGFRLLVEKGEDKKPKWISTEAYSSVLEAEGSVKEGYKSSISLYLKRRVPSLILMTICLGYLISGQIYDIIVYLIDSFAWIFEQ